MNKIDSLIAPQTKEFVKLCRKYIEYLEQLPDRNISDFWTVQLRMLPEIYTAISHLPRVDVYYSSDVEKFVTEREYNKVFMNLVVFIGALDKFPDFTDLSHPGKAKVLQASLSEMLTDIYQELKDFVMLYETGTLENMNDALAECFESFGKYWGVKLLSATRIIHVNLFQHRYAEAKKASQTGDDDMDDDDDDDITDEENDYYDEME